MKSRIVLLLTVLIFSDFTSDSRVGAQAVVIVRPIQDVNVVLPCDVTGAGVVAWRINGTTHLLNDLFNGAVAGHNISGRNLVVEDIMMNDDRNGSQYRCEIAQNFPDPNIEGNLTFLYVAGVPSKVPGITVDENSIKINGSNVTITLSWGEPFNNLDPIVSYTVSCSGGGHCPPDFTTTDNITRNYTITNLTTMINYTFSVVATNSIGSGEAGVEMITTPGIDQVTVVNFSCKAVDMDNKCTVTWALITEGNITGYVVKHNRTMMNVNSSTNTSTFLAPLLPDDVFNDTVVVTVTAMNESGIGIPSELGTAQIYGSSITDVTVAGSFNVTTRLTTNDSDTDVYISYTIAVTNIISLNISNMTRVVFIEGLFSNMTHKVLSSGENFALFLNSSNRSIELSVLGTNSTNSITADLVTADMVNVTVVDIEENYNMSVTCNIHPKSMADMCMVVAMGTDNNIAEGIAPISNNMANVMFTGLNCSEEYTIIAGGIIMLDGSLFGPKSNQGTIYAFTCDSVSEAFGRIFNQTTGFDAGPIVGVLRHWGPIVGVLLFLSAIIIAHIIVVILIQKKKISPSIAKVLRNQPRKLALFFILGVLTFGISSIVWFIWECRADKDVQPDKVEMQSGDVYASPKKKETDVEATSTDQGLYSYARTGPINVVVPGGKP